jgi:hypothetical protein
MVQSSMATASVMQGSRSCVERTGSLSIPSYNSDLSLVAQHLRHNRAYKHFIHTRYKTSHLLILCGLGELTDMHTDQKTVASKLSDCKHWLVSK